MFRASLVLAGCALTQLSLARFASAQISDERVRVSVWYARQLLANTPPPRRVLFLLHAAESRNLATDSLLRSMNAAFQTAGLPLVSEPHQPGPDTLLASVSAAVLDSANAAGRFYSIYSYQSYCGPGPGSSAIHAIRLRCTAADCHVLIEGVTGTGMICNARD